MAQKSVLLWPQPTILIKNSKISCIQADDLEGIATVSVSAKWKVWFLPRYQPNKTTVIVLNMLVKSGLKNADKCYSCLTEAFLKIALTNVFMPNLVMVFSLKVVPGDLDKA